MTEQLLTIKEAAYLLNIGTSTLRRMVWASEIGYIDLNKGGRHMMVRFTKRHLAEFLREREAGRAANDL
ncbi:MAG: helix-turn-helix domain-containing protein [Armatimonadota bacterium]|jgi:excisionase family DNA binding protein